MDSNYTYLWLIPLLPLGGFLINGLFGKKLGDKAVGFIGPVTVLGSFIIALSGFFKTLSFGAHSEPVKTTLFNWISVGDFNISATLQLDQLSIVMSLVVSGVGFIIHVYSIGYMHGDKGYARYFSFLNLFTFAMLLLVMADNYLLLFIGWEGVGLCSYLLIGFWYEDWDKASAGKKAFIVNRIGDFGFALGMLLIFVTFGSLTFTDVFSKAEIMNTGEPLMIAVTLLLFVGATGKSAQIPLYVWLPDAMAGPTPVSALIHAATMVTAGVYMIARSSILYALAPVSMMIIAVAGGLTAVFAASIGLFQNDIKKVLAYSTISQLGYMFLACGVGAFAAGIFHLMTHAFFKALLFLGAGSVIHAMSGEQDIRNMGGLKAHLPKTYITFLVAALAISGIPGLSGFFSKDEILWSAFSSERGHIGLWIIGAAAAGMTAFYMFRLVFLTFFGESRVSEEKKHHLHESPNVMTIPLIILAGLSIIGGYAGIPHSLGGSANFDNFLSPVFEKAENIIGHGEQHSGLSAEYLLMFVSVLIALIGIYIAYQLYLKKPELPKKIGASLSGMYNIIYNKYYIDEIYDTIIVKPFMEISKLFWKFFDVKIIDGFVNGIASVYHGFGMVLRRIQAGYIQVYVFSFLIGVIMLLGYYLFK